LPSKTPLIPFLHPLQRVSAYPNHINRSEELDRKYEMDINKEKSDE